VTRGVLPARLRRTGRRRPLGMAVRRPPCLPQQPRRRRRARPLAHSRPRTSSPPTAPPSPRATRSSPLAGIWRGERLADDTEQVKLQALNDAIDEAAGFTPDDHRAVEFTAVPRASRAATRRLPARPPALPPRHLLRPRPGQRLAPRVVRRFRARRRPLRLGRFHPARAAALLPAQGPRLLIEWDNTQRGANHAHSVWRDPEADFGLDVLAPHRAMHH
jgi:hypothetical protein